MPTAEGYTLAIYHSATSLLLHYPFSVLHSPISLPSRIPHAMKCIQYSVNDVPRTVGLRLPFIIIIFMCCSSICAIPTLPVSVVLSPFAFVLFNQRQMAKC